ncbi:hypothetical protein EGR_01579 [Echinococcus granulosus]|uniref:Uncharacterized protein n=1 Tax=Echinococcus granulosus TaxID=6210 RepID=W6UY22_ECHGR|nr:hypothetical protein EGR_01579 [Echinococcus granulosus]EUB63497.1 hypothetical protein EGR_01579 [Echinococcus granulosus]
MVGGATPLYYPNSCEINHIKASEILKRRQIRIVQVRRLSKIHSAVARNMYQRKKLEHLDCENRRLQRQQMLEDFALLQSKQSALNNIMDSFGYGHRIASSWKDPMIEEQKRLSTMRVVAKKRFDEAYTDLLVTRARSLREAEMRHHFRETARAAEQARAAAVAALPPPSCDPLDPHLNPNGDACTRCLSEVHKECHLVVDANRVPLGSGNWGRERAKKSEKRSGLLGGGVMAGEAQCGLNVCHLDSSCATGAANDDAFTTAAAENARADLAHRRTLRLATEAALKSRIRAQLALKRTHAMQEYELLTQHPDPVPVGGLRIDQSIHIHDGSSFVERPLPSSSDEKPIPDTQCTTLMHPSPDLSGLGPGERAGLPPLALSPRQSLIAQPLLSPHPASDSSQTLIFRKRSLILPLSIATIRPNPHTLMAKIFCPSDSSEATGLDSTGTNALNAFKPLEVHFNVNKVPDLESYCVSGVNNILSSTELSEITSFDRIKMQLDSEVENIDKAIRELRETFNKSILSRRSAQGIEVNLTRISPPSTSSDSVTIHPQSPLEVIDVQPGTTTMTGVTQDRTLYRTENRPSGFIDGRIGTDMRGTKCQMICNNFDALKESVESGHYTSHMLSLVDVRSNEKGKEKQSPSPTAPIIISPSPVPLLITETGAFTLAKSGTGAKPFAVVESLRRRARELILRQTECIRASNAENHASACETPGQLPHCFISLAHGDDADLQSLSLPAKTPIFSPVKHSSIKLLPFLGAADDESRLRLIPKSAKALSPKSNIAIDAKQLRHAVLLYLHAPFKEAGDDDVDLFTGTIGDFVVRKKELLRHYLKQLLETYRMKSEISTLHCSGTYLSPTSTSQIRLINNVVSKSTDRISPVCPNQYNNNFKPRNTLPSDETLGPNPPKPLERDVFSRQSPPCSDSDLLQGCFKRRFCEQNEILKPINHSVHSSASTPHAKEHSVSHLNRNDSGDALSSTFFPRFVTSSSSALEISCDSSSGRPLNQFSVLSCQTLPISLTSTDTEKNFKSSASMRQKFTITESASGTLGTHRQSSPVNHLPSQSGFIRLQAPEAAKEYIVYDSSPLHQEGKTDSIKTYLGADLLQVPVQNQLANKTRIKYSLQSIATGLEDKMNSQIISNASIPTDSTPNSSSRPSNQFSCLSSQSPCFPAEVPFVSELEASQEPIPYKPVAPSVTSGGSATTTLHALRSGLSIGSGNEFKESHVQPSGDVSVGTLNIVKGERHTSASTLARLRGDVMADESSSPLSSDLSSIITTNNNASPLRQSNDLMNGEKEPPPGGVIHQTRRFSYSPLVPSETPLISIRLEPPSTNNVLEESETVVQTLLSADQKEEHDVAAASAFAMLPAVKVDTRKSAFSGLISSEERSNIVSSRISVGSKSIDVKASSMMSDTVKVGSMKSAAPEADTRGANNAKAIVLESVDAKVGSKEVGNAETTSAKSVGANTVSGDAVGRKASEAKVILQKLADERPIAMKPAIMGPEGVEANGGGAGAIALVSGKTADARGADAKPIGVKITDEAPTYVKYVGLKSLGGEVFVMPSAGATTAPAIELTSTKKANAKVATGESFIPKSSATKSASVLSVGVRSGFVESPSAEASGTEAKHSGPTSVKLFIAKSINRESLAAVSVTATNVGEKGLLTESITANVKSASIANLTDLEAAEMQAFSIKASALETSDQNGIPFEPAAARISVAKSNSPEPYMTELARPKVSGPSLLAADSGSTRLASAETTDIEQNLDSPLSHQPDGTVIYAVATPRDLPAYLTADTAATIARMRKVQEELERKGSNSLPNPRTRLLAGLQEELSVPPDDLSSTRSFIRKESSITFQVTLPSLTRDQSERKEARFIEMLNELNVSLFKNGRRYCSATMVKIYSEAPRLLVREKGLNLRDRDHLPLLQADGRRLHFPRESESAARGPANARSRPAVSGEILSANFPFGRFYLRKPGSKQCSDSKGTSHQNFANPIVHKKSSRQRTKKPSRVNPPPRST